VRDRLGWLTIAPRMLGDVEDLQALADHVASDGLRDVVLLGMGGSSLAPEVIRRCFGQLDGEHTAPAQATSGPAAPTRLHVLDSTDAATIAAVQEAIDPSRTLFLVSSKSGGTIEPLSLFAHFWSLVSDGSSFVAITDPGSGLQRLAEEHRFRRVFAGDPDIGGRYSALSPFGIVPAALIGVDVRGLLAGADRAWRATVRQPHWLRVDEEVPVGVAEAHAGDGAKTRRRGGVEDAAPPGGVWLGATLSALAQAGRDKLTFMIDPSLPGLGLWLEQLVAESTGKHGTGILPVAEEPPGEPAAYGDDRVFLWVADVRDRHADAGAASRAHAQALADAGHPVLRIATEGPDDLGSVFMLSELAVAVAGWGLQINPFDQPNVQQAKDATNDVLAGYEKDHALPEIADADAGALRALVGQAAPPSYVAIMGYVQPSSSFDAAVAELRQTIRTATKATTTFGYGPRFFHSTGQFHKGGPRTGRFLQLLHDGAPDNTNPRRSLTFTTHKHAQAPRDQHTLRELGLPAERVRLTGDDPAAALRKLTTELKEILP
jgi:glucose-6-phosphate isomerase